jgi:hypothetical protein
VPYNSLCALEEAEVAPGDIGLAGSPSITDNDRWQTRNGRLASLAKDAVVKIHFTCILSVGLTRTH